MNNREKLKWMILDKGHRLAKIDDTIWATKTRSGDLINYCSPSLILTDEEREAFGKVWFYEEVNSLEIIRTWQSGYEEEYNMTWNWTDEEREAFVKDKDEADKLMKKYKFGVDGCCYDYDDVLYSIEKRERIDKMYREDTYLEQAKEDWMDYWIWGRDDKKVFDDITTEYERWRDLFIAKWFGKINRMSDEMVDSIVKKNNNNDWYMIPEVGDMIEVGGYCGKGIVLEMLGEKAISVGMKVYIEGKIKENWWGCGTKYDNDWYSIVSRAA